MNDALIQQKLLEEKIDITLENDHEQYGTLHPLSKTIDEISAIFANMGFYIEGVLTLKLITIILQL